MTVAFIALLYVVAGLIVQKLRWVSEVHDVLIGDQVRGIRRAVPVLLWPVVVFLVWLTRRELKNDAKEMLEAANLRDRKLEQEWTAPLPPEFQGNTIGELVSGQTGKSLAEALDAILRIELTDAWTGLSVFAPIDLRFELTRENNDWRCHGKLTFYSPDRTDEGLMKSELEGYAPQMRMTESSETLVNRESIDRLVQSIDSCPIARKVYIPNQDRDDDRPSLAINIETQNAKLCLYSGSQGDDHVPWALEFQRYKWVVDSPLPADAMRALGTALKRQQLADVLENCKQQYREAREDLDRRLLRQYQQRQI